MQDKQKVTLYLPPELHRQLKIRAAVDTEPMSNIAERAIKFYLAHPEIVEEVEANIGRNMIVYNCPECASSVVVRDGEMVSLKHQPTILGTEGMKVEKVQKINTSTNQQGEEELVIC